MRVDIPVPYITPSGKISALRLGTWHCTPEQWFASVLATVYNRLLHTWNKRTKGSKKKYKEAPSVILKFATLYIFKRSNYEFDRFFANLRPGRVGVAESLYSRYARNMDDNFRFVSSQASFDAHWLTFRAKRPRDKSIKIKSSQRNCWNSVDLQVDNIHLFYQMGEDINPFISNPYLSAAYKYMQPDRLEELEEAWLTQLGAMNYMSEPESDYDDW